MSAGFARRAGAVNTLIFRDGRIEGSNTDGFGFLESIREAVEASGSLEYTAKLARDYVARAIKCLDALPASETRTTPACR